MTTVGYGPRVIKNKKRRGGVGEREREGGLGGVMMTDRQTDKQRQTDRDRDRAR